MISIKRSLDLLEQLEGQCKTALACYRRAIAVVEAHMVEVERDLAEGLRKHLRQMRESLNEDPAAELMEAVCNNFEARLREFKALSEKVLKSREQDIRTILEAVAEATAAVARRADYHAAHFQAVARQLESAVQLDSLSLIRERVAEAAARLKSCTETMHSQSRSEAARLQDQLHRLQRRLEQAETLALTDPLTGLANRRRAEALLESHLSSGKPVTVFLFDLDHFKTINDRHGHPVGDQVLIAFGERLAAQFEPEDAVCRWGGDEFLAIATRDIGDPFGLASSVILRMRGMYALQGPLGPVNVEVNASVGVASYRRGEPIAELLARADATLYENKRLRSSRISGAAPCPTGACLSP